MKKLGFSIWIFAGLAMAGSRAAWPCGLCHEDDRSAVYSYQADQKAKAQPDKLEFAVFKIVGALTAETTAQLESWLKNRSDIDPTTVKVSRSQKSMGFVMARTLTKTTLIADLEKNFPNLKFHALEYP